MTRRHQTLVSPFRVEREIFVIRGLRLTLFPHVPRTSPLSSSVFHAACALSAPTGHLPLEGKALSVVILFPHMRVFALMLWGKRYSRIVAFPIGEGGPRQRWIGCSRISST